MGMRSNSTWTPVLCLHLRHTTDCTDSACMRRFPRFKDFPFILKMSNIYYLIPMLAIWIVLLSGLRRHNSSNFSKQIKRTFQMHVSSPTRSFQIIFHGIERQKTGNHVKENRWQLDAYSQLPRLLGNSSTYASS